MRNLISLLIKYALGRQTILSNAARGMNYLVGTQTYGHMTNPSFCIYKESQIAIPLAAKGDLGAQ